MSWEMEARRELEIRRRRAIVELLSKHNGMRKRYIDSYMGTTPAELVTLLCDMCDEGVLICKSVNDFGNMERYNVYYLKG